jgi:hypothetical protein
MGHTAHTRVFSQLPFNTRMELVLRALVDCSGAGGVKHSKSCTSRFRAIECLGVPLFLGILILFSWHRQNNQPVASCR